LIYIQGEGTGRGTLHFLLLRGRCWACVTYTSTPIDLLHSTIFSHHIGSWKNERKGSLCHG
jgi:hypothetical protein